MTPNQIAAAYKAVHELTGTVFPYKTARAVVLLKKKLREEFDVIVSARNALVKGCGGRDEGEYIHFDDNTASNEFYAEYQDMMNEDVDIELPHIDLSKYADSVRISPDAIAALEGIVAFEAE